MVGAWLRRALVMVRRARSISPLPAGGARERQRAPKGSDTFSIPNEVRPHCAAAEQGRSALPRYSRGFYGLKLAGEDYD